MRSLVITAVIILVSIMTSVVGNAWPYLSSDNMPDSGLNQSMIEEFNGNNGITTSSDGQNQFYTRGINIIDFLWNVVTGAIFIGGPLQNMGMAADQAIAVNAIFGLLVAFDLLLLWRGIHW